MSYTKEDTNRDTARDIVELEKRCSAWHENRGVAKLLLIVGAILIVAELIFHSTELGRSGLALVAMLTIGGFLYYLDREKQDEKDWKQLTYLQDLLKRGSDHSS
ncbi:MAG: hypothetical protein WBK91_03825 [Alphaproteobacteria bacterium]